MSWLWKMPQYCPWPTPYPLPRDTSEALLAEGQCENFGLLLERYLAFGDNRGQVQLLRELGDRKALVPDFTPQKELLDSYRARWEELAEDLGAVVFRPAGVARHCRAEEQCGAGRGDCSAPHLRFSHRACLIAQGSLSHLCRVGPGAAGRRAGSVVRQGGG